MLSDWIRVPPSGGSVLMLVHCGPQRFTEVVCSPVDDQDDD